MESPQFSTSRGHTILVRDVLTRYQPDALRYFICAAGLETSDTDFTWREFVQRTNPNSWPGGAIWSTGPQR